MSSIEKRRLAAKSVLLGVAVACLVTVWMVTPAMAAPCWAMETNYWGEPEMINEVGWKKVNCTRPFVQQYGQTTPWFDTVYEYCCGNCPGVC